MNPTDPIPTPPQNPTPPPTPPLAPTPTPTPPQAPTPRPELRAPSKPKPTEKTDTKPAGNPTKTPAPTPAAESKPSRLRPPASSHGPGPKTWGDEPEWRDDRPEDKPPNARRPLLLALALAFLLLAAALLVWRITTLRPAPLPLKNHVLPELSLGGGSDVASDGAFADARLADAVRKQLKLDPGTPLTNARVKNLETLDARGCATTTLLGIETLSNLQTIDLRENDFTSLRPLRELAYLTSVDLRDNPFSCTAQKHTLKLLAGKGVSVKSDCE